MIRANSPKFSAFTPFGVKVTHLNAMAHRALTLGKLRRAVAQPGGVKGVS